MIAVDALFIDPRGPYPKILGPERCWDEKRDARAYTGAGPLVLHPPCAAWCQLAGVREARYGYKRGEDGGLFAFALDQLRKHGGVLEHPAYSKAWDRFALRKPKKGEGWRWFRWRDVVFWVAQVSQCAYGHRARKRTWLLYHSPQGVPPLELDWSEPYEPGSVVISGANNHKVNPAAERMWTTEAKRTPDRFAVALVRLAAWSRA